MQNFRLRRNYPHLVLIAEQWTSSLPLQAYWVATGAYLAYLFFVVLEKTYNRVAQGVLGGILKEYVLLGLLL